MAQLLRTSILLILLLAPSADVMWTTSADDQTGTAPSPTSSPLGESGIAAIRVGRTLPSAHTLTEAEQALVDWARDRFSQAGLELPELTVRFDPSRELCGRHEGLYHHTPDGERVVTICAPDSGTYAAELQARRTLLHEFAHAWDVANLSEQDHEELARILGADAWNGPDVSWEDRGVEQLAETFVFALLDQPRRVLKVSLDCSVVLDAFRTATEADPLGPGRPACAD